MTAVCPPFTISPSSYLSHFVEKTSRMQHRGGSYTKVGHEKWAVDAHEDTVRGQSSERISHHNTDGGIHCSFNELTYSSP